MALGSTMAFLATSSIVIVSILEKEVVVSATGEGGVVAAGDGGVVAAAGGGIG